MADIFLSYVRRDKDRVRRLVARLRVAGFALWWDDDIAPDAPWETTIERELAEARAVVVCWSAAAAASENVRAEARRAKADGRLIQVFIELCEPPLFFGERQGISLFADGEAGDGPEMRRLIDRLATMVGKGGVPETGPAGSPGAVRPHRTAPTRRRAILAGGAAAFAIATGAAGWRWLRRSPATSGPASVAVMPFANLSGDPAQAYFSDGLAEELRGALGRLPGIRVIARISSEKLRDDDAVDAARKLGVSTILTGSVRRSASLIRVSAQLVDGASGVERWSQSYDRPPGDALAIETGVAESVARELRVALGLRDRAAIAAGGTDNAAAHDLYLKARAFPQIARETEARQKLALIDAALALDPHYAAAHVLRASTLTLLGSAYVHGAADTQDCYGQAADAARRAIALAPNLSDGYTALALILAVQLHPREALSEFHKAEALGANGAFLRAYSKFLVDLGRTDEAIAAADRGIALDPLNPEGLLGKASALFNAGRYREAVDLARRKLAIAPDRNQGHFLLSQALLGLNRPREARAEAYRLPPDNMYRWTLDALIAAREGDRTASDRALARIQAVSGDAALYQYAEIYAQQGDTERAIAMLERAWTARDPGLLSLPSTPFLAPVRADPRFKALVARLDFP